MYLCEENYFSLEAEKEYCGSTQFKRFYECPAKAMAIINGEWQEEPTNSQLIGSYVDASISKTLDIFKVKHPEIFKKDKTLKSEFVLAEKIVEAIRKDSLFNKYVSGDNQRIFTGEIEGLKFKVKTDSFFEKQNACVDLKVVKDFEPIWNEETRQKENFVDYWKYTWQAAIYSEIIRQNIGKLPKFYIAAITKEKYPDKVIMNVSENDLLYNLEIIKSLIPGTKAIKEGISVATRCEKCDYCKATKRLTKIIDYHDLCLM